MLTNSTCSVFTQVIPKFEDILNIYPKRLCKSTSETYEKVYNIVIAVNWTINGGLMNDKQATNKELSSRDDSLDGFV